ncbi:MAG: stability determinant [Alcaligenaceae bacterium]|nr:stability determinant [Alcaligenaceae bacterium]
MTGATALDPRVSEFETQEQADCYDRWFRAKVQEAIESKKKRLPHDAAMARIDRLLEERRKQRAAG